MCRRDLDESVARAVEAEEKGFEDISAKKESTGGETHSKRKQKMGSAALRIHTRSCDAKSRHLAMQETETIRYWIGFIRTRTHRSLFDSLSEVLRCSDTSRTSALRPS